MTTEQRRKAARRWLKENQDMSLQDIKKLALKWRIALEFDPTFADDQEAGRQLAELLDTAARIKARQK